MLKATTLALSLLATGVSAEESRALRTVVPNIQLGVSGNFVVLSASGITDEAPSVVVGDVGTSPISGTALLLTCDEVIGNIYTVDAAGPLPCRTTSSSMLTTAIGDMIYAYNSAKGVLNPDFLNLEAGLIGGQTLVPGVYKFASSVNIVTDITIEGTQSSYDRWIFQVDNTLNLADNVRVRLTNGAQVKNIIWVVSEATTLGASSHFEGIILDGTAINVGTAASVNGRLLAQTAVTLSMNTLVQPQH
jgi:hypothetical protein